MKNTRFGFLVVLGALLLPVNALCAPPPPPFEVAYRARELVLELARHNANPSLGGECARTFRPFVAPGLRMQSRQEQDLAAILCVQAARSACANDRLRKTAATAGKCDEFR